MWGCEGGIERQPGVERMHWFLQGCLACETIDGRWCLLQRTLFSMLLRTPGQAIVSGTVTLMSSPASSNQYLSRQSEGSWASALS